MKILVTGAAGYLGSELFEVLSMESDHEVVGIDLVGSQDIIRVDVSNQAAFSEFLKNTSPDIVIHTAAIKDLVRCETDKENALRTNVISTETITEFVLNHASNTRVVYISSDVVFDGKGSNYSPEDIPSPINWYGKTKVFSEILLRQISNHAVLRTALLIGDLQDRYRALLENELNNSILQNQTLLPHYIFSRLSSGMEVRLPTEIISNPTPLRLLTDAVISQVNNFKTGTFHIAGSSALSRLDFAKLICKKFSFDESLLVPDNSTVVRYRPKNISLNTKESLRELGLNFEDWTADKYLNIIKFGE